MKLTPAEFVAAVDSLFDGIPEPTTKAEIDAELREAGYDPEAVAERMRRVAVDALTRLAPQSDYKPVSIGEAEGRWSPADMCGDDD